MNEHSRLAAVKRFADQNYQTDAELRQLLNMASEICNSPIALITLIDENTQWIKTGLGTDIEYTPRNVSFCNYAIEQDEVMIVNDAALDDRFADTPYVNNSPHVRFYAGAPLITIEGYHIGTLCVFDKNPKQLNQHQLWMLKLLSKQVINLMELKLSNQLLQQSRAELEEQKHIIQQSEIKLRSFFESSANFHVLLGKHGEVIDYNKVAYRFIKTAYGVKITRGSKFIDYIEPSFREIFTQNFNQCILGNKSFEQGFTDYTEFGRIYWEATFNPAYNGDMEIIGISYIIQNVTEHKLYELKIIAQNKSLLKIAHIQAHEYRGPLTTIMGVMNLIKEENYEAPLEYLKMLEISIHQLDERIHHTISHINQYPVEEEA